MGTRAQFFMGDPRTPDATLLGCKDWDGYPSGIDGILDVKTEEEFRALVSRESEWTPDGKEYPYPWTDDIFLTDYTYAWVDGALLASCYHHGLVPVGEVESDEYQERPGDDPSCVGVSMPLQWRGPEKDGSIMILYGPSGGAGPNL